MAAKETFSISDVLAISNRIRARAGKEGRTLLVPSEPVSPIAARIMREVGVSDEELRRAYVAARKAVGLK